jgi:hypothetical protein
MGPLHYTIFLLSFFKFLTYILWIKRLLPGYQLTTALRIVSPEFYAEVLVVLATLVRMASANFCIATLGCVQHKKHHHRRRF